MFIVRTFIDDETASALLCFACLAFLCLFYIFNQSSDYDSLLVID